ncbi:hypothetical protein DCAR_0727088 [Daucus carota subsp. sativus]|uniref:DUF4228 domain-containing protein n=1 Tax=Daucus carota subsp. sativus TaxID=79200 RepID=A0AAF1B658_DAUCS|nr:PREDICTED: uncharacterized protein LOC108194436 [Daucus carota subsp. sativus]WOH07655.1 hypothetical protein DCAR_0727088 [Daucus carota subsp. sativus]
MGNYVSSCTPISSTMKSPKAARVIFPSGEIRQFREPLKAAELMLECPSFFVVNSKSLNVGKRFSPLSADEDLEFGNIYILFSMKRVNSMVTGGDMAVVFMAASSAPKRLAGVNNNKGRVLPETAESVDRSPENDEGSRLNLDEVEGFSTVEIRYRLAVCRSKKPLLETITEEPLVR